MVLSRLPSERCGREMRFEAGLCFTCPITPPSRPAKSQDCEKTAPLIPGNTWDQTPRHGFQIAGLEQSVRSGCAVSDASPGDQRAVLRCRAGCY